MIDVRLFASLREIAGESRVPAAGHTVGELVDELSARYGERFARIAEVGSYVVNGERAARGTPVAEGDDVAVLPPVSGGAVRPGPRPLRAAAQAARPTRPIRARVPYSAGP